MVTPIPHLNQDLIFIPYLTGGLLVGMMYPFFDTEDTHDDHPLTIVTDFVLAPRFAPTQG